MENLELIETVEIPWQQLSTDTLAALIEEFVTRDGTDYGEQEINLAGRSDQVRQLLSQNKAVILFSQESGQCNIVARERLDLC